MASAFDPTACVLACSGMAKTEIFWLFLSHHFIRPLLCLTSLPAVHKHTTHPAALSSAPSAPSLYLRLSCLEPFPSFSLSLPLLLPVRPPARCSSAKAANIRRLCLIFCVPHKGSDSLTFYCSSLLLLGCVLEKMMYKTWCLR